MLIDVRETLQFQICHLPNATSTSSCSRAWPHRSLILSVLILRFDRHSYASPFHFARPIAARQAKYGNRRCLLVQRRLTDLLVFSSTGLFVLWIVYVVCRRGNQSQRAVQLLRLHGFENSRDIIGGMARWAIDVDPSFPVY